MTKKFAPSDVPKYLMILEEMVTCLGEMSERVGDAELARPGGSGDWSVLQNLAHICACQDVWAYSIYAMLSVEDPELFPLHPRKMAATMKYDQLSFSDLFSTFRGGREELLRILNVLPESEWQRKAIIGGRQHSVFSQVRRMAKHDLDHWEQIDKLNE